MLSRVGRKPLIIRAWRFYFAFRRSLPICGWLQRRCPSCQASVASLPGWLRGSAVTSIAPLLIEVMRLSIGGLLFFRDEVQIALRPVRIRMAQQREDEGVLPW